MSGIDLTSIIHLLSVQFAIDLQSAKALSAANERYLAQSEKKPQRETRVLTFALLPLPLFSGQMLSLHESLAGPFVTFMAVLFRLATSANAD
jgi:hypothetical protein